MSVQSSLHLSLTPCRHSCCHGEAGWYPEGGAQGSGGGSEGQSGERPAAVQGHSLMDVLFFRILNTVQ